MRIRILLSVVPLLASLCMNGFGAECLASCDSHELGTPSTSWTQLAKLSPTDALGDENFFSVAVSGDTIAGTGFGGVYVYVKGARWKSMTQTALLSTSDGKPIGRSVAISGDTIVVGAPDDDSTGLESGSVYVFVKPAGGWVNMTETAKLTASDASQFANLGHSVAISGDTIVAGALGKNSSAGAAYVFEKPVSGWSSATQTAELSGSTASGALFLGVSVAIDQDTIVAGASNTSVKGIRDAGAAFVYVKPASGWRNMTQTATLIASQAQPNSYLGKVAISGDTIAAAAPLYTVNGVQSGAVFVYQKPATGWRNSTETATLTESAGTALDNLGFSLSISGNTIIAGAPNATVNNKRLTGAVYTFEKPSSGWTSMTETSEVTVFNGTEGFGFSVSIDGNTLVGSSPYIDQQTGAIYVFGR